MSSQSKPLTLARLNDLTLGAFANVRPSETLDHLVRYLSTWSGSDKLFQLIQYTIKLLIPFLHARARLQQRYGLRKEPISHAAERWAKLEKIASDSRTFFRIWGILPIIRWLISLERNPPPTRNLLTIERIQGWSMLAYYPLEHIYYLNTQGIIPQSIPSPLSLFSSNPKYRIKINPARAVTWSCRCWALYVALQLLHLAEDRHLLLKRERTLKKAKDIGPAAAAEKAELGKKWDALYNEVVLNLSNLPLALHWSLPNGLVGNELLISTLGFIAAVAAWRGGWKASALPLPDVVAAATSSEPQVVGDTEPVDEKAVDAA